MFAVYEPYFRSSKSLTLDRRKKKKRKAELSSTQSETDIDALYQQQVREAILTALNGLLRLGQERGMFLFEGQDHEGDKYVESLKDVQHIDFVQELSNLAIKNTPALMPPLVISSGDTVDTQDIFNRMVHHSVDVPSIINVSGGHYLLPVHSSFLMSDASHLEPLLEYVQQHELFDLVVVDPPWYNKSARRASKYSFMSLWQIKALPVPQLLAPNALVALWVTNKSKYIRFAKSELFPYWSVELIAEWHWVKVTNTGELVVDLDSPHKKPYETLLIGRYDPFRNSNTVLDDPGSQHRLPRDVGQSETLDEHWEKEDVTEADYPSVKRAKIDGEKEEAVDDVASQLTTLCASIVDESYFCVRGGICDEKVRSARWVGERSLQTTTCSRSLPRDNTEKTENDKQCHTPRVEESEKKRQDILGHKVICSVPCKMHSRKPPLDDVLSEFLKPHSVCLEMFARSLTPHWTSWGNEVLKFQDVEFFDGSPS